jgi:hemerythrin-like metal-binding protein
MQWGEGFKTGIEEIDIHHEGLFERIHELFVAFEQGRETTALRKQIIFFEGFLVSHFALEEVLMKKLAYPDYSSHYNEHIQLANNFSRVMNLLEDGEMTPHLASVAVNYINNWMKSYISHLNLADRPLTDFLKNRWQGKLPAEG